MAVYGRARWFYENMVDLGQYHTMETIIGLRTATVSAVCIATTNFRWEAITVACGRRLLRAAVTSALNSSMHISIFHLLKSYIHNIIYHDNKIFTLLAQRNTASIE